MASVERFSLSGRAALVTGAAKRVGRAIAQELAKSGCHVAVHYRRSKAEAEQTAAAVRACGVEAALIQADLNDSESWARIVDETVDRFGRVDLLVNNASMFVTEGGDRVEDFSFELAEAMLRVNLLAPMALSARVREYLVAEGGGAIVNLCDISADRPWPGHLSYCASKAGLVAATKALARALAPEVSVFGVSPGIAEFPPEYGDEKRARLVQKVPAKRTGTPEEVARLVRFLVEDGRYLTGAVIPYDGGRHLV